MFSLVITKRRIKPYGYVMGVERTPPGIWDVPDYAWLGCEKELIFFTGSFYSFTGYFF